MRDSTKNLTGRAKVIATGQVVEVVRKGDKNTRIRLTTDAPGVSSLVASSTLEFLPRVEKVKPVTEASTEDALAITADTNSASQAAE
jgi:hypothetical protein